MPDSEPEDYFLKTHYEFFQKLGNLLCSLPKRFHRDIAELIFSAPPEVQRNLLNRLAIQEEVKKQLAELEMFVRENDPVAIRYRDCLKESMDKHFNN